MHSFSQGTNKTPFDEPIPAISLSEFYEYETRKKRKIEKKICYFYYNFFDTINKVVSSV